MGGVLKGVGVGFQVASLRAPHSIQESKLVSLCYLFAFRAAVPFTPSQGEPQPVQNVSYSTPYLKDIFIFSPKMFQRIFLTNDRSSLIQETHKKIFCHY